MKSTKEIFEGIRANDLMRRTDYFRSVGMTEAIKELEEKRGAIVLGASPRNIYDVNLRTNRFGRMYEEDVVKECEASKYQSLGMWCKFLMDGAIYSISLNSNVFFECTVSIDNGYGKSYLNSPNDILYAGINFVGLEEETKRFKSNVLESIAILPKASCYSLNKKEKKQFDKDKQECYYG